MDCLGPVIVRLFGDTGKGLLKNHMGVEEQVGKGRRSSLVIYLFFLEASLNSTRKLGRGVRPDTSKTAQDQRT